MRTNEESFAPVLKFWRQIYQTHNVLKQHEDQVLKEYGLSTEKLGVLAVISYLGGAAKITDIGRWLERSSNSVTMIVDRMVKAGLVKRRRDRGDRRVVFVSTTGKGEAVLKPAYVAAIGFICKILQPLSPEDMNTVSGLLRTVKYQTLKQGDPAVDTKETERADSKRLADERRWLGASGLLSRSEAKCQSRTKSKTGRRAG
jgi:DNA-binding MarR family transcriptional regulator